MEDSLEENPYNLLFNTSSFVVEVSHRNICSYEEYSLKTIDYKRTGSFQRLERFRINEARRAHVNSSGHNFRVPLKLLLGLGRSNQEGRGSGREIGEESRGSDGEIEEESEEEIEEEEPTINTEQTFKEDECVICLTNPLNVLFCFNCGHIAI